MRKFTLAVAGLLCFSGAAHAEVLTFIPQFDQALQVTNYNWFSPENWFVPDSQGNLEAAGRVPVANETAVITGMADAGISGVRVQTMVLTNNAVVTNGTFSIQYLQMLSGSTFKHSDVNLVSSMAVNGTNCVLSDSTVNMLGQAIATVSAPYPGSGPNLSLQDGSLLDVNGILSLTDGVVIMAEGAVPSRILVTGLMTSSGNAVVNGGATNLLVIDNSAVIRAQEGTLTFAGGIGWESGYGRAEFQAAQTNSLLVFNSPFAVPNTVTNLFTGPGVSRVQAGASVEGLLLVGADTNSATTFTSGCLEVQSNVSGSGEVDVLGAGNGAAILRWNEGKLTVPLVSISAFGELQIAGTVQGIRRLAGSEILNFGRCVLSGSELVLENGAQINNAAGAVLELASDGVIRGAAASGGGTINNSGTVLKTSSGTASLGSVSPPEGPDLNNNGLVDVRKGLLNLFSGASDREFHTEAGAVLSFWGGTHTLRSSASFTGAGLVRVAGLAAPARWLASEGLVVPVLQLGTNGTVVGGGTDTNAIVRLGQLLVSGDGTLAEGIFEVSTLEISREPLVTNSTINVAVSLHAADATCTLGGSTLRLRATSRSTCDSTQGKLTTISLSANSALVVEGTLGLAGSSVISGEDGSENKLAIASTGLLSCTNVARILGDDSGHLIVDNSGLIAANGGSLEFQGALSFTTSGGIGHFQAATLDSIILFDQSLGVPASKTLIFSGAGTNRLMAGADIAGLLQVGFLEPGTFLLKTGRLEVSNNLAGAGRLQIVGDGLQGSVLAWLNGQLGVKSVDVDEGGKLLVVGNQGRWDLSGCAINLRGTFSWPGQPLSAGMGSLLNVFASGNLEIQNDGPLTYTQTGARLAIRNWGVVSKSGGTGATELDADVFNHWSLDVHTGALKVKGILFQDSGQTELQPGASIAAPAFDVLGGSVSGTGRVGANLNNSGGMVTPGAVLGILTIGNSLDYQQGTAGSLRLKVGGTAPGLSHDQLVVGGKATLSGTLELQLINGFVPLPGQAFEVLKCNSLSGKFSSVLANAPVSTAWVTRYTATNVLMLLASDVKMQTPVFSEGQVTFGFATTPGVLYVLQACSIINGPWEDLQTIPGDGSVKTVTETVGSGNRFFRLASE